MITGKTLEGNYVSAPRKSGRPIDEPTGIKVTVTIGGEQYERTVMERRIWRNMGPSRLVARFVKVNGVNYEVDL